MMFQVEDNEKIIVGPDYTGPLMSGSIAEYMVPRMKKTPKDFICQVDYATNESITSYEFLRNSLEVAEGLVELGLKTGDVVGFVCSSNIPSITAAIGAIISGAAFTPIDITLKTIELQHLFKQFQPKFIFCETAQLAETQKSIQSLNPKPKIILTDSSCSEGELLSINDVKTKVDVENYTPRKVADPQKDIALICCSSGSTGMPKGIALSHFSLLLNVSLTEDAKISEQNPAILFTSPLYWVSGLFLTLYSCFFGMTRYIPKSINSGDVLEAAGKCKPLFIISSPASLYAMAQHPDFNKYDLSSIKMVFSAGSILSAAVAAKIKNGWKDIIILNSYGMTEVCGSITTAALEDDVHSVGKVTPEVKIKVVDTATGKSLGPNETGECRVKSRKLMNGYYNNEEETRGAFDEKGWFCTGDLVYYNEQGVFYVVGRKKDSISFKTYDISPAEIESFIIGIAGVKDVAIVGVPHEIEGNYLRALIVKDPNSSVTAQDIIDSVKESFTERKHLKAGVQFVEALPRSEVGKLRRLEAQKMIYNQTSKVYFDKTGS